MTRSFTQVKKTPAASSGTPEPHRTVGMKMLPIKKPVPESPTKMSDGRILALAHRGFLISTNSVLNDIIRAEVAKNAKKIAHVCGLMMKTTEESRLTMRHALMAIRMLDLPVSLVNGQQIKATGDATQADDHGTTEPDHSDDSTPTTAAKKPTATTKQQEPQRQRLRKQSHIAPSAKTVVNRVSDDDFVDSDGDVEFDDDSQSSSSE